MNKSNVLKAGIVSTVLLATVLGTNVKVFGATNDVIKDVKYVNSTLVDFDCNKYNAKMRNLSKQKYDGLSQDEKARVDQNMMLFGMCYGLVSNGHSNQFVEPNIPRKVDGVSWNLAKSKLEDNNLKIVDSLKNGTTFFPRNATIGNEYVQALNNWKFPFKKEKNGYYSFDSNKLFVVKDYANKKFILKSGNKYGFYPFNNEEDDTKNPDKRNLYFTARFDIPFIMTRDGKTLNSETGKYDDMVFDFSGDDDVWVYVDDELVLDLGGAHTQLKGNINFAKNKVWYELVASADQRTNERNVEKKAFFNKLSQGKHTLKVFYMERAGGDSNLKVTFNLQSSGVKVRHIDKESGEILKEEYQSGEIGKIVKTAGMNIDKYVLVEAPENAEVVLKEEEQIVNYYYSKFYDISVKYIDINKNNEIAKSEKMNQRVNSEYGTDKKDIKGYTFVKVIGEPNGRVVSNIDVKYFYKKNSKIKVNYIEKKINKKLDESINDGLEGDDFKLEKKNFKNYVFIEGPKESSIKFLDKDVEINYYYIKESDLIVKHIDKDNNKIMDTEIKKLREGSEYSTSKKEFDNYILVKKPEIEKGTIGRNNVELNYFYRKLRHNLSVDMNIVKADIKGRIHDYYGKLVKADIPNSDFKNNLGVVIDYKIVVKNTEEKVVDASLIDYIPNGYMARIEDNPGWEFYENTARMLIKNFKLGERREYLFKIYRGGEYDVSDLVNNNVEVKTIDNYKELNLEDNRDSNKLLIVPKTGVKGALYGVFVSALIGIFFMIRKFKKNIIKDNK